MQQVSPTPNDFNFAGTSPPDVPGASFHLFSGSVERVVYFNEETGQCVLDIYNDNWNVDLLISGRLPFIYPGLTVECKTSLDPAKILEQKNPLMTQSLKVLPPRSKRALKKFLKSEALPQVGPSLAHQLAESFPEDLLIILEQHPEKLLQVQGIGRKRQAHLLEAWHQYKALTQFETFLFENRLPLFWARRLWPRHRGNSLEFLTTHPYAAVMESDLDFELADAFALRGGFSHHLPERLKCGVHHLLVSHYRQGHCAYPENLLLQEARDLLTVPISALEEILEIEILSEKWVSEWINETKCIYLKGIWDLEQEVASQLLAFQFKEPPWGWFNMDKVLNWAQSLLQIRLAPRQKQAIETALSSSLTIITGGPGTGKTTLIRSFVTILQTQFAKFALCSPTGRAAQRLEEATGTRAQTIHRLLKYSSATGGFIYNESNPLDLDLVLIDEVSMLDLELTAHLLRALPKHCALIFVGDADQIPSVGAGNILQSLIDSGRFSTVRLTDIFRQSEKSQIKINANRINAGEMPEQTTSTSSDFNYIPVHGIDETKSVILNLINQVLPLEYGLTDSRQFQILVPLNRGPLGTLQLNEELQKILTAKQISSNEMGVSGFGQTFRVGDKVMVIKNDYKKDIFNGDIGFIERIDHSRQSLEIQFEQRNLFFDFEELDRLTLAYAISIHKSQGSEYRAVIVVIGPEHLPLAKRHLIYTAVTRGKEKVFLVADPVALQAAIQSDETNRRWQKLTELLRPSLSPSVNAGDDRHGEMRPMPR